MKKPGLTSLAAVSTVTLGSMLWLSPSPVSAGRGSLIRVLPETSSNVTPASAEALADYREAFRAHCITLSQPFFEGRAPGTEGNRRAADYLEFEFRRMGLQPAIPGDAPSFRQPFQMGVTRVIRDQAAGYQSPAGAVDLKPGADFNVLAFSGDGDVTAPVVFVGYAIEKGESGYASFEEGDDLTGKIAMLLRFEPMNEQGKSQWSGEGWSMAAGLEPKIQNAVKRGAAGVILVSPPGADDPRTARLETITSLRFGGDGKVPVIMMSSAAADSLVKAADAQGRSLLDLRKLADQGRAVVELPGAPVKLKTQIARDPVMTDNVIGLLPGAGALVDQYIVVGAHYDHVGYGSFGSRDPQGNGKLHPGADDNASGTGAMLVIAKTLKQNYDALAPDQARRSVLFMGFTAEESGLNGSRYYTQHMIAPKDNHTIMINLDMVGRLREGRLEIGGVGTAEGLEDLLKPYWDSSGLQIAAKKGGGGPSDHASFNAAQIPVLFFHTGLHDQYHMPTDTWDTVNPEGAAQVIDLVHRVVRDLAVRPETLTYSGTAGEQNAAQNPGPMRGMRVRFGIAPGDYSGDVKGVLIGDITEGGSAAEAGLKAGDLMTAWNGKPLTSVESWMPMLAEHNPGDVVEITYLRDGQEAKTSATLKSRRGGQ